MFTVARDSRLDAATAWTRLVDWPRHADFVPLTTISVPTAPPTGVGSVFVARTQLGRFGFDDPMEVTKWRPPADGAGGYCRLEKRGRVVVGWAELRVEPRGTGSWASWREQADLARLPAFARFATVWPSRLLFTRVLRGLLPD